MIGRSLHAALAAIVLTGCGPRVCGTMEIRYIGDDLGFDVDDDGYAELDEACGATAGSYAFAYPNVGVTQFGWSWSFDDLDTDLLVASVWAPAGLTAVWTDALVPGATIGPEEVVGSLIMTPTGNDYDAAGFALAEFSLTVNDTRPGRLAEGGDENTVYDVTWHATFVDGAASGDTPPYAILDGHDDVRAAEAANDWDVSWDGPLPPE